MIPMRVAAINGFVLTYDVNDVEDVKISTPNDAIETTQPDDTARHWKLGKSHLYLHIDFKEGASPPESYPGSQLLQCGRPGGGGASRLGRVIRFRAAPSRGTSLSHASNRGMSEPFTNG